MCKSEIYFSDIINIADMFLSSRWSFMAEKHFCHTLCANIFYHRNGKMLLYHRVYLIILDCLEILKLLICVFL